MYSARLPRGVPDGAPGVRRGPRHAITERFRFVQSLCPTTGASRATAPLQSGLDAVIPRYSDRGPFLTAFLGSFQPRSASGLDSTVSRV
ncbi:hypothetical protein C474_08127 [Halogeometricum pallidum JCM 14848]|uniref:Uncharacterized protein n=1 Tax=Halogeometricum pallidum JCM 14848 TaxID=1227487 RepID=M0D805_HALPD|nr:hypothetical protein C474_08127 [Halogeometricum pallidum JCM 14848]